MPDKKCAGLFSGGNNCAEPVCIHTSKVYDQCKSKECIRDLRVYLPNADQALINNGSVSVKPRCAELLHVNIDVEKIQFHRGFFTVDIRFFYRITVEICTGVGRPTIIDGLAVYDKRCILFGSEGGARIFSSKFCEDSADIQLTPKSNMPRAVVEVVDPVLLEARICPPSCCCRCEVSEVPPAICRCFQGESLDLCTNCNKLVVTLGQFSIIKLERDVQLLMPEIDFCIPDKDCSCNSGLGAENENPCELFESFEFPVAEFFPPQKENCSCNRPCKPVGNMTTVDCNCSSVCSMETEKDCDCKPCDTSCGNMGGCNPCGNNSGCGSGHRGNCRK